MRKILTILALAAAVQAVPARADEGCFAPMAEWQPREAVAKMALEKGWTVTRIRIDDGCYQIRGVDPQGHAIKVMVNPATLEVVKTDDHEEEEGD